VSCTLSLLKSSLRRSPLLKDDEYARRQGSEDDRFVDYFGTIQSIVTSTGSNDGGMFETNLREERFLPFEGAGVVDSTWKLELPSEFRQFDYNTISDVILHMRYTARQGGSQLRGKAAEYVKGLVQEANTSGLALLFSLKHDFPSEWHQFVTGNSNFAAKVKRDYFPYFTQGKDITIDAIQLHAIKVEKVPPATPQGLDLATLMNKLKDEGEFEGLWELPWYTPTSCAVVSARRLHDL
jgi:Tc toxin complex TcA C-terminal TcB-binding domain